MAEGQTGPAAFPPREPSLQFLALEGHVNAIESFSFSPDGARIATSSWDGTVRIYQVATGREILTFKEHDGSVGGVTFSPDGQLVASAAGGALSAKSGKILIWNKAFTFSTSYVATCESNCTICNIFRTNFNA